MDKWNKYSYVCPSCDSLTELYTKKPPYREWCLVCTVPLNLVSEVDATIYPDSPDNPVQQKEEKMQTMTDSYIQEIELKYGNEITELKNELDALRENREYWLAENGRIDVPLSEVGDFDLTDALSDAYVDINNGYVVIDNYEVDTCEVD